MDCYRSLYGVSLLILVTGFWIPPLGYTRHYFSIQVGHQFCWCKLLLNCSGHVYIFCQEHLLCLTDIFHLWRGCMFIDFQYDTNFHKLWLLLHHPVWYIPHELCWYCVCWAIKLPGIYLWWFPSGVLLVMRYGKIWVQDMGDNPITMWECPSWDSMMHPQHSPMFFALLLHQGRGSHIFLHLSFQIILHPLLDFSL